MNLKTPQRLFNNLFNPNVMGYEIFILFPSIILYFMVSFVIGTISAQVISKKENKSKILRVSEVIVSLWIIAIGHKLFTILTPTYLESASSNIIFAFVAMSANDKVGKQLQLIVSEINSALLKW